MAHTPGIGAPLLSRWASRDSLIPREDRVLASLAHRWWFGTSATPVHTRTVPAIAQVTTGWTGELVVSVGGSSYVVTVAPTTSLFAIVDRVVRAGARRGGSWSWALDSAGVVTIRATVAFDLIASGTTRTRLGMSSIYAGQMAYSFTPEPMPLIPSLGLSLIGADQVGRTGGVTQAETVAAAATGLRDPDATGALRIYGTPTEIEDAHTELEQQDTWDVALGAHVVRVRVLDLAREAWGKVPLRFVLVASVMAVTA